MPKLTYTTASTGGLVGPLTLDESRKLRKVFDKVLKNSGKKIELTEAEGKLVEKLDKFFDDAIKGQITVGTVD